MAKADVIESGRREVEPRRLAEVSYLALSVVGALTALSHVDREMGLAEEINRMSDGSKSERGVVDFLYAIGAVDDSSDGSGRLVIPEGSVLTVANIAGALRTRDVLTQVFMGQDGRPRELGEVQEKLRSIDVDTFPAEFRGGLVVPILGVMMHEADTRRVSVDQVREELIQPLGEFLEKLELVDDQGQWSRQVKFLLHQQTQGYVQLDYSYLPYLLNLDLAVAYPESCGWGEQIDRWHRDNAWASNRLISNIMRRLGEEGAMKGVEVMGDLGSGGGYFLWEGVKRQWAKRAFGFDISGEANGEAGELFAADGRAELLVTLEGDLAQEPDLINLAKVIKEAMVEEWGEARWDKVALSINYLTHDFVGKEPTREGAKQMLSRFFKVVSEHFPRVKVLISEVYEADRQIQREDGNVFAIGFALKHAVSPQYLWGRQELIGLLGEVGFVRIGEVVHRYHRNGEEANSTLVVVFGEIEKGEVA